MFIWTLGWRFSDEGIVVMFDKEVCLVVLNRTLQTIYPVYQVEYIWVCSNFRMMLVTPINICVTEQAKGQVIYSFVHIGMRPISDWYRLV